MGEGVAMLESSELVAQLTVVAATTGLTRVGATETGSGAAAV